MSRPGSEAERAVLGAVMLAPTVEAARALVTQAGDLQSQHFGRREHGVTWDIERRLITEGRLADSITVARELEPLARNGMRPHEYLGALLDGLPRITSVSAWADIIRAEATASGRPAGADNEARPVLVRVADIPPERVEWLWMHRIPLGKLTVLDGDPGLGKSTVTLDLTARVSRGTPMPGEDRSAEAAGVVLLTAEDGIADTIRPRLEVAGADLERIEVLTAVRDHEGRLRLPMLPDDVGVIRDALRKVSGRMLVIDPLMAFLSRHVDAHRDQDVRGALHQLSDLAEGARAAVLVVRHLNKATGGHPIYRGGGSIGIIGAARSGLLVAPDPRDETRRVLAVSKANLGPVPPSLAYRLGQAGDVSRVQWEGIAECSAKDLLAVQALDGEASGARAAAETWLRELLAEGPVSAKDVRRQADEVGHSWASVRRAQVNLGVRATRIGGLGAAGHWYWEPPVGPGHEGPDPPKVLNDPLKRSPSEGEHLKGGVSTLGTETPEAASVRQPPSVETGEL